MKNQTKKMKALYQAIQEIQAPQPIVININGHLTSIWR